MFSPEASDAVAQGHPSSGAPGQLKKVVHWKKQKKEKGTYKK